MSTFNETVLAELKELNIRLGRIEQLLQPKKLSFQASVSGAITREQVEEFVQKTLQQQYP